MTEMTIPDAGELIVHARELAWRKFGVDTDRTVGEWVREARAALRQLVELVHSDERETTAYINEAIKAGIERDEAEQHVAELTQACADLDIAIEDLTAERDRYRAALQVIARGTVPPPKEGHYLAHREAVRLAREALAEQKD